MIDKEFDEYIEQFKSLPLEQKKKETINELKTFLASIIVLNKDFKSDDRILLNKELIDVNKEQVSEEDFVEAVFVYLYSIQNSLGDYVERVSKIIYEED